MLLKISVLATRNCGARSGLPQLFINENSIIVMIVKNTIIIDDMVVTVQVCVMYIHARADQYSCTILVYVQYHYSGL